MKVGAPLRVVRAAEVVLPQGHLPSHPEKAWTCLSVLGALQMRVHRVRVMVAVFHLSDAERSILYWPAAEEAAAQAMTRVKLEAPEAQAAVRRASTVRLAALAVLLVTEETEERKPQAARAELEVPEVLTVQPERRLRAVTEVRPEQAEREVPEAVVTEAQTEAEARAAEAVVVLVAAVRKTEVPVVTAVAEAAVGVLADWTPASVDCVC